MMPPREYSGLGVPGGGARPSATSNGLPGPATCDQLSAVICGGMSSGSRKQNSSGVWPRASVAPISRANAVPSTRASSDDQIAASIEFQVAFQVLRAPRTSRATARSSWPPGAAASIASLTIGQTHSRPTTAIRTA